MNNKVRMQLSVMMFVEFFIWGAWLVPMWQYLNKIGFSGSQIGAAYSTGSWAAIISPFFVGLFADRFFSAERVLAFLHVAGGIVLWWASGITQPGLFFWVLLLYTICYMPTLALVNSISFSQMSDPAKQFPSIRVLGTIGWIVAGLVIGFMPQSISGLATIEDTAWPLKIAASASILLGIFCLFLPHTPPKGASRGQSISDILGLKALGLMKDPSFATLVISSFLICIPLAFYYQSANGFLGETGLSHPAGKMTLGQCSEIFFMLVMPLFFARLGVKKMMLIGMLAWGLRYVAFALGNSGSLMAMLYLGIVLHGICYDFFFVTGQIYVDRKAPRDLRASAQGFITLVTYGVGMVIGNYINGWVSDAFTVQTTDAAGNLVVSHQWPIIWLIPAVMAGLVLIGFAIFFRDDPKEEQANALQAETQS